MGLRSNKPCRHLGCRELTRDATGYCEQHRAESWKAYDRTKDKKAVVFYHSARWRKIRKQVLDAEPLCRECGKAGVVKVATVVDHIVQRALRPDLEAELSNLQALCEYHHNQKRRSEQRK